MGEHSLAGPIIRQLAGHPQRQFADKAAWQRHLEQLGIAGLEVTPEPADRFAWHRFASRPDPVRVATEGALWGAIAAHGFLHEAVIVSDDAGQFNVGTHALCRVGGDVAAPTPQSGRIEARTGLRMMPTSPRSPPIIPYGGFSLSTAGRLAFQTAPSRVASSLSLLPAYAVPDPVCIRPSCIAWLNVASVLCRSIHSPMHHRGGWVALRPRGPRSGPGCSVLVRHHLIGPIRPTRGHIAISPFDGLYVMPSLCGSA